MPEHTFTVVIEQDEDGLFVATCPALQGCYTQGQTYEEAMANIREAIELHLEARRNLGEPIPQEVGTATLTVTV
jgi:predicted RNase H-like HicB family nuclease